MVHGAFLWAVRGKKAPWDPERRTTWPVLEWMLAPTRQKNNALSAVIKRSRGVGGEANHPPYLQNSDALKHLEKAGFVSKSRAIRSEIAHHLETQHDPNVPPYC
jgi:hypothetical protein